MSDDEDAPDPADGEGRAGGPGDEGASRASRWSEDGAGGAVATDTGEDGAGGAIAGDTGVDASGGANPTSGTGGSDQGWPTSWVDPVTGGVVGAERTLGDAGEADDSAADGAVLGDYRTEHWRGIGAIAFLVCGLGLVTRQPGLVLAGVVGAVYAGYGSSARPPRTTDNAGESVLELDRSVDDATPAPGETVSVALTVGNVGPGALTDIRVVDGVPSGLEVVDGSPRFATALRPGETDTVRYEVQVPRGDHEWGPARVVVADPSGGVERETTVSTETTLRCVPRGISTDVLPLRDRTTPYTGRIPTDAGGDGVEFHATREYRPGDPLRRIDWYRRAKTGELGTLEFREERAGTVVLLVDARRVSYLAPTPESRHAVERGVDAAIASFGTLLDTGDRAGVAVFGRGGAWLPPGTGEQHRARGRELLTTHPALSPVPPAQHTYEGLLPERREQLRAARIDRLHGRLPDDAQVLLFSPCCDDYAARTARRLDAYGHPVTVISPDPTTDGGPAERLARMERADRLAALRREGIRILDWPHGEPFATALERARARWSE